MQHQIAVRKEIHPEPKQDERLERASDRLKVFNPIVGQPGREPIFDVDGSPARRAPFSSK